MRDKVSMAFVRVLTADARIEPRLGPPDTPVTVVHFGPLLSKFPELDSCPS
jgi:hypothetical protein